jgi:outer membrane lipoprotein SlyB
VYGAAAANHVSKLLRTNVISGGVVALIASTPDFYRAMLERSISWKQLSKNVSINVAGIASGTAGWMGGVAIGASIGSLVPVVGTAAGGIVGGVLGAVGGGIGGTTAAKKLADKVVTDDQVPLMAVIQREFQRLAFEHVLTETETDALAAELQEVLTPKWFRTLYKKSASGTDESALLTMVQEELTPRFEAALERREWVALPDPNNVAQEIWIASEQICDASLPPF